MEKDKDYVLIYYKCGHNDIKLITYKDDIEKQSKIDVESDYDLCHNCALDLLGEKYGKNKD